MTSNAWFSCLHLQLLVEYIVKINFVCTLKRVLLYKTCFLEMGSYVTEQPWALLFLIFQLPSAGFTSMSRLFQATVVIILHLCVESVGGWVVVHLLEWEFVWRSEDRQPVWDLVPSFHMASEIEFGSSGLAANTFTFWAILKAHTCFCGGMANNPTSPLVMSLK